MLSPNGSRAMLKPLIVGVICFFYAATASAATYFISPSGLDTNPGSQTQPWRTIAKAASVASAGDVVNIRGGTYNEKVSFPRNGTTTSAIVFQAYQSEVPVVDGAGITSLGSTDALLMIDNRSYVTLRGLEIRNSPRNGVRAANSIGLVFENLKVHHCSENGIAFYNTTSPSRSYIRNNTVNDVSLAGILLWKNTGGYFVIEDNTIYNVRGAGNYDGIESVDNPYLVIRRNTVHDVGIASAYSGEDYIDVGGDQNIEPSHAHHVVDELNIVYRGNGGNGLMKINNRPRRAIMRRNIISGIGIGFYEQPHATVAIYHNTVVSPPGYAIQFWTGDDPRAYGGIHVKNNILAFPPSQILQHSPRSLDGGPANILMDGNLYRFGSGGLEWVMATSSVNVGNTLADYNTWRTATGQEPNGGIFSTHTLAQLFEDHTTRNYKPKLGSPAIDAARPLTVTTSAGSGTQVPVRESFYFYDGFGMTEGDVIRVGSNPAVRITALNESTNTLTVNAPIAWSNGAEVTLDYQGTKPDVGALEFDSGTSGLPSPQNVRVTP